MISHCKLSVMWSVCNISDKIVSEKSGRLMFFGDDCAVLFKEGTNLYIGRIFIAPEHFRKGLGIELMEMIENFYSDVTTFTLDTPLWNIRTNNFYQKLGYEVEKKDKEFAYYVKRRS